MLKNKIIAFFLTILMLQNFAKAEESVPEFTRVQTGQSAPFSGYLFTSEAMGKMLATIDSDKEKAAAKCQARERAILLDLERATAEGAANVASKSRLLDEVTRLKNEELAQRDKTIQLLEADKVFGNFLIAGSFIAGIALTVGVVYITNGASK